jgi:hypothetical protein
MDLSKMITAKVEVLLRLLVLADAVAVLLK